MSFLPVGRFAPSPTGPLHRGSLFIAVASYLDARARGGRWLLRIEDLDTQRCRPHYQDLILQTLQRYALNWDGEVWRQSARREVYAEFLQRLHLHPGLYACRCSRLHLRGQERYPGTCRHRGLDGAEHALRVCVDARRIDFDDRLHGAQSDQPATQCGDFVVWRREQGAAYQLAVVVDDALSGVNSVLRGADLLDNTARQIFLQQMLGLARPEYTHLPLLRDAQGRKLSKQNHAPAISLEDPVSELAAVLAALGHPVSPPLCRQGCAAMLAAVASDWDVRRIPLPA